MKKNILASVLLISVATAQKNEIKVAEKPLKKRRV
jgi:hypothetical protein